MAWHFFRSAENRINKQSSLKEKKEVMTQGLSHVGWLLICIYMVKSAAIPECGDFWESGLMKNESLLSNR